MADPEQLSPGCRTVPARLCSSLTALPCALVPPLCDAASLPPWFSGDQRPGGNEALWHAVTPLNWRCEAQVGRPYLRSTRVAEVRDQVPAFQYGGTPRPGAPVLRTQGTRAGSSRAPHGTSQDWSPAAHVALRQWPCSQRAAQCVQEHEQQALGLSLVGTSLAQAQGRRPRRCLLPVPSVHCLVRRSPATIFLGHQGRSH